MIDYDFDIIVVGGGHAGVEAACVARRLGKTVGLVTMDKTRLALMSCNPAIGGVAKGHLVREVDALGGVIGLAADYSGIQFRRLNLSKGPAVRSTRVQCDRRQHCRFVSNFVAALSSLTIIEDEAIGLLIENGQAVGVQTKGHKQIFSRAVILCTGTFLGGLIHIGKTTIQSGRHGEPAAVGLTSSLHKIGLETGRLKTGTPPRVDGRSIDYEKTEAQPGHRPTPYFSHFHSEPPESKNDAICYLTYTTLETAKIIHNNLDRAPLYSGQIKGIGPRYCPSIEDKVVRFVDKPRHQIFIEPEGDGTDEIYPNGFSTSLPEDVQCEAIRTIIGFEKAEITRPGYAIEYDFVPPHQIKPSLETKKIPSLFLAGQINGTSGYEEAAAQGFMAGINASLMIDKNHPFILGRHEAYIGVMIDDLVTRNISEPYRMFTSRAEYRLALREDNALARLSPYGKKYALYTDTEFAMIETYEKQYNDIMNHLTGSRLKDKKVTEHLKIQMKNGSATLAELLCRPDVDPDDILALIDGQFQNRRDIFETAAISIKYRGYLERQDREIERHRKSEGVRIPESIDFKSLSGLKVEAAEKLCRFHPITLGQASRIEGVTPSDIAVLTIHLKRLGAVKSDR